MTDRRKAAARPGNRLVAAVESSAALVRSFYSQPIAWAGLLVSSAVLSYGGGAVMFWVHAIVRGEAGPAIDHVHHWVLDSTLGFVALTPVLGLILPLAVWHAGGSRRAGTRARLHVYVIATAALFTLVTGPGPLLHNWVAGAGTPLADLATKVFGENPDVATHVAHASPRSPVTEGLIQLGVGLPVYLACTWLALLLVRTAVRYARPARAGAGSAAAMADNSQPTARIPTRTAVEDAETSLTSSMTPTGSERTNT